MTLKSASQYGINGKSRLYRVRTPVDLQVLADAWLKGRGSVNAKDLCGNTQGRGN